MHASLGRPSQQVLRQRGKQIRTCEKKRMLPEGVPGANYLFKVVLSRARRH